MAWRKEMKLTRLNLKLLLFVMTPFTFGTAAVGQNSNVDSDIQILRSNIRADKTKLVSENMKLSDAEAKAFWPVYQDYETELTRLNDKKVALIKEYANSYDQMTDAQAKSLTERNLALEKQRTELKENYFNRLSKVVSARTAARFLQVDNRIDLLLNVQLASAIPIVQK
jgi:uncharacterized membrane protein